MRAASKIDEPSHRTPSSEDPLELLKDQLQDLLLIHMEQKLVTPNGYHTQFPSLYLIASRYVSGVKSAGKSSMRFELSLGMDPEVEDETLILELNVRSASC